MPALQALQRLPIIPAGVWLLCAVPAVTLAEPARLGMAEGLPSERASCVLQDRYGFVWIGTENGLVRWDGHRLRHFRQTPEAPQTLPSDDVRALFESRSGHLWAGTDAGLARFERELGFFRPVSIESEPGTRAQGVDRLDGRGRLGGWQGRLEVVAMGEDDAGRYWVATTRGLLLTDPSRPGWQRVAALDGQAITALAIDQGRVWVGSESGVAQVTVEQDRGPLVSPEPLADGLGVIAALGIDRSGALWAGGARGVEVLDVISRQTRRIATSSPVTSIYAASEGSVMWIGTESGLVVLTVGTEIDVDMAGPRRLDGRAVEHLGGGRSGQIWAATDGGVYGLPPATGAFLLTSEAPDVTFTGLQVDGRPLLPAEGSPLEKEMAMLGRLALPAGSRMVTLEMAALRFESLGELRYSYRLRGFHEFWQGTGADRPQAVYSSLPPGTYVLEARAAVGDGPWGGPRQLTLEIEPPRWRGAGALALILLGAASVIFVLRRLQRAKEHRESLMAARLNEMHEQKLESLATLAGGVAHDFNNLLVGIFGHAELAKIAVGDESAARTHLERILTSARRAAELSKQMLFYSGRAQFVVAPVELDKLVEEEVEALRLTIGDGVRLLVDTGVSLPAIEADAGQLRQVVSSLVVNAAEALDDRDGFIAVGVRQRQCDEAFLAAQGLAGKLAPGAYVAITVEDTAGGIDEESIGKIFDPFFSTKSPGRGLGLAAAQGIAQGHGGALFASSVPGRGTTFECLLPVSSPSPAGAELGSRAESGRGQVLVVESDLEVRGVARKYLDKLGFDSLEAADHATAMAVFGRHRYRLALVLLELQPGGQGLKTLRELRRLEPSLPVVLTGALEPGAAARQFEDEGPLTYLEQPLRLAHLQKAIRENVPAGAVH